MKKSYTAPAVYYENFELSTNIATCELIASSHARYTCPVYIPENGWTIFAEMGVGGCVQTPADGEQICYEIPLEDYNVLVS